MKRTLALVLTLLMLLGLCACGAGAKYESAATDSAPAEPMAAPAEMEVAEESYAFGLAVSGSNSAGSAGTGAAETPAQAADPGDKIIYSCNAEIETRAFDETLASLRELIDRYGGFLESSSVRGNDYYGSGSRSADYTIRIPREHFEAVTESLSTLGNVPYCNVTAENISASYYDTESRLSTYRIEEERLLSMLALAETVEDMITIESRLSEVRYSIESLTSTLQGWDSLVNYSTLSLSIYEVEDYTPEPEPGYWQRIGKGFMRSLEAVGEFFMDLFRFLVVNLPVLVLLGAAAWLIVFLVRRNRRKRAKKEWGRTAENAGYYNPAAKASDETKE